MKCPICNRDVVEVYDRLGTYKEFKCAYCGHLKISDIASVTKLNNGSVHLKERLSTYLHQLTKNSNISEPIVITDSCIIINNNNNKIPWNKII